MTIIRPSELEIADLRRTANEFKRATFESKQWKEQVEDAKVQFNRFLLRKGIDLLTVGIGEAVKISGVCSIKIEGQGRIDTVRLLAERPDIAALFRRVIPARYYRVLSFLPSR